MFNKGAKPLANARLPLPRNCRTMAQPDFDAVTKLVDAKGAPVGEHFVVNFICGADLHTDPYSVPFQVRPSDKPYGGIDYDVLYERGSNSLYSAEYNQKKGKIKEFSSFVEEVRRIFRLCMTDAPPSASFVVDVVVSPSRCCLKL